MGDIAEPFYSAVALQPGDVVALDPARQGGVRRATRGDGDRLFGVVAIRERALVLSFPELVDAPDHYPISFGGRVPIRVSAANGPIGVGDFLTSSSVPGVAVRAIERGLVVAQALEPFAGTDGKEGKVLCFVRVTSWGGPQVAGLQEQVRTLERRLVEQGEAIECLRARLDQVLEAQGR